jgi:O-antigen/teichoic acid export membrane protein
VSGILAGAQKYVMILFVLGSTFFQAWQVAAVKNFNRPDSSTFFTEVFNKYAIVMCLLVLCISFGLRTFPFLISPEFNQSIHLLYIFCVSNVFFNLALFFEVIYHCTKQTTKLLHSLVTCAAFAPLITFVLVKHYGMMGNLIALTISSVYLFIYKYFQTKSTLPIRLKKEFFISILGLATGGVIFYYTQNRAIDCIVFLNASLLLSYFLFVSLKYIAK